MSTPGAPRFAHQAFDAKLFKATMPEGKTMIVPLSRLSGTKSCRRGLISQLISGPNVDDGREHPEIT